MSAISRATRIGYDGEASPCRPDFDSSSILHSHMPNKDSLITSNWKRFHDALQAHRFDLIHDILPRYGISAA